MASKKYFTVLSSAYIRDGKTTHTGKAVLLACLMHTKGNDRTGQDMADVQRIMYDKNAVKGK